MLSKKLEEKLEFYEQYYFALDLPVPFKNGLMIYPVKVKDYIKFYSCLPCLTMDKNVKIIKVMDEKLGQEVEKKVSNPQGIAMSYMQYLIETMQNKEDKLGAVTTSRLMGLLELVFHIENGLFCPECGKSVLTYKEIGEILSSTQDEEERLTKFQELLTCPECGAKRREIFSIKNNENPVLKKLMIFNTELTAGEFDEFVAIVTHYNMLNYEGDKYMDPTLKEEMEIKARLENKDYRSPSLEKQMVCVSVGTGYKIEELREITLRKLTYLLRTVDRMHIYYAQMQGAYSGMVKFKKDPTHWIFGDDRRDFSKEITSLEEFNKKMAPVTGG